MAVLRDILGPGLKVVFCGSAVGPISARVGAYYANPNNRFWRVLHEMGLTPHRLTPHEFPTVRDYGLGLTDLAKHEFGVDAVLSQNAYDPAMLRRKIRRHRPRILAFVGKKPASAFLGRPVAYGLQPERIGETLIMVLPSTSPLAMTHWDDAPWRELARQVLG